MQILILSICIMIIIVFYFGNLVIQFRFSCEVLHHNMNVILWNVVSNNCHVGYLPYKCVEYLPYIWLCAGTMTRRCAAYLPCIWLCAGTMPCRCAVYLIFICEKYLPLICARYFPHLGARYLPYICVGYMPCLWAVYLNCIHNYC